MNSGGCSLLRPNLVAGRDSRGGNGRSGWRWPAAAAVIVIVVMNHANAPQANLDSQPAPAASPKAAPPPAAKKELGKRKSNPHPFALPRRKAVPAPVSDRVGATLRCPSRLCLPRRHGASPYASRGSRTILRGISPRCSALPRTAGAILRVRSGPDGNEVPCRGFYPDRRLPGFVSSGTLREIRSAFYPESEPAAPVAPDVTIQIPSNPIKIADAGGRLRLVVFTGSPFDSDWPIGRSCERHSKLEQAHRLLPAPPPTPLIIDIPLAAKLTWRTHSCVPRSHSCERCCEPGTMRRHDCLFPDKRYGAASNRSSKTKIRPAASGFPPKRSSL